MANVLYVLFGLVAALLGLGVIIFVHELGHFFAAKRVGVGVKEFSIGFGKKLWGFKKGETEYSLKAIPFGGSVRMLGCESELEEGDDPSRSFMSKSKFNRLQILVAGVVFNFLFAIITLTVANIHGVPRLAPVVKPTEGPAAHVLCTGDKIKAVNGVEVRDWEELRTELKKSDGSPITLTIVHDGFEKEVEITPVKVEVEDEFGMKVGQWIIGITLTGETFLDSMSPAKAFAESICFSGKVCKLTGIAVVKLFKKEAKVEKTFAGPVYIVSIMTLLAKEGFFSFLHFLGILSLILSIMNALPIPVLDGGHIMFLGIEAVRGKPLNEKVVGIIQSVFFLLLIYFMMIVTFFDVSKILGK